MNTLTQVNPDTVKKDKFIEQNLGLVHSLANKFRGKGIEYDDLYSAGCVGLIKAVDGFKKELGYKFSTYAVPVILGEIKRLFRDGGSIKVSRSLKELSLKVGREKERFMIKYSREPTIEELASILGTDSYNIVEALNVLTPPISLTANNDDDDNQLDIPCEDSTIKFFEMEALNQIVTSLPDKEQKIIKLRYFNNKTQSEVAKVLDMTQVQVSRKEKKILLYIREHFL